jgi:hypothetical protein
MLANLGRTEPSGRLWWRIVILDWRDSSGCAWWEAGCTVDVVDHADVADVLGAVVGSKHAGSARGWLEWPWQVLPMNLVVPGFSRRWPRRNAWLVRVRRIFRFLPSLHRTCLQDQSVAGFVACEEVLVSQNCSVHWKRTRSGVHHEVLSVDRDPHHVFVLPDNSRGRHLRAGRYRRTPYSRPSNRKRGRAS